MRLRERMLLLPLTVVMSRLMVQDVGALTARLQGRRNWQYCTTRQALIMERHSMMHLPTQVTITGER